MAKEPAYIIRLREYASGPLGFSDLHKLEAELFGTNDRAAAVLYAALVEQSLTGLISKHLREELNSRDRKELFGTFDRVVALGYAMNLIGPVCRFDLNLIRTLRNAFAHSRRPLRFDDTEVADVCAELKVPDWPDARLPFGALDRGLEDLLAYEAESKKPEVKNLPRNRFVTSCQTMSHRMVMLVRATPDVITQVLGDGPPLP